MIPKIIHQTWKTSQVPPAWRYHVNTWKWQHPDWEYRFWNDDDGLHFITDHFPDLIDKYVGFPYAIQRADLLRYALLYHYGGLYADIDYECLRPFDDLIENRSILLGYEPEIHARDLDRKHMVSNALMASSPQNDFFAQVLNEIKNDQTVVNAHVDVLETTGPLLLSKVCLHLKQHAPYIFPADVLSPVPNDSEYLNILVKNGPESIDLKLQLIQNGAYAIHYWSNSWVTNLAGDLINQEPETIEGFTFIPGMDSHGYDLFNGGRNIKKVGERCFEDNRVVAFNTDGFAKSILRDKPYWNAMNNAAWNEGLYVKKEIDF